MRTPAWAESVAAWPPVARHVAAVRRANGLRFTRWAAAVALFGYLSLFPLLTLAFVVFSVVLARTPELQEQVQQLVEDALPGILGASEGVTVDVGATAAATVSAGVVAVLALLYAGLGWVNAALEGVRRMLGALHRPRNLVLVKLEDAAWLLTVGGVLVIAVVASIGMQMAGDEVFSALGWGAGDALFGRVSSDVVVVLLVSLAVFAAYGFAWRRPDSRWWAVVTASVLVAVTLDLMLRFAYLLVGRTLENPVYGTLAVAAALLLFLYFASAVLLYGACWLAVVEGRPEPEEVRAYYERSAEQARLP